MVYLPEMHDLMPSRTASVTFAAILAMFTGLYGLVAYFGVLIWGRDTGGAVSSVRLWLTVTYVIFGCASIGALIGGIGILFRRNRARVLAIVAAVPLIYSGLWDVYGLVRMPASLIYSTHIVVLAVTTVAPLLAAIAWPVLLIGKKIRAEFLPPAMVEIYVNLLNESAPRTRATQAVTFGNGLYELLAAEGYDPDVEDWEFRPGTIVRGIEQLRDGEAYLLATSFGP
jgi:hypothetical protein